MKKRRDPLALRAALGEAEVCRLQEQFGKLLQEHYAKSRAKVRGRFRDYPNEADDFLAEVLVPVWNAFLEKRGKIGNFQSFLSKSAIRRGLTHHRNHQGRYHESIEQRLETTAREPRYEDDNDVLLLREALKPALEKIRASYREVLTLRMEGMSELEVAEALNLPLGTVKSRCNRGRKELETVVSL